MRKIVIVPNDVVDVNIYDKPILEHSIDNYIEFSDLYGLNYNFSRKDFKRAPDVIAKDGHLVVKFDDDNNMCIIYLPVFVSNNQYKWLNDNTEILKKYNTVGVFNYIEDSDMPDSLMSVLELLNQANIKNDKYNENNNINIIR